MVDDGCFIQETDHIMDFYTLQPITAYRVVLVDSPNSVFLILFHCRLFWNFRADSAEKTGLSEIIYRSISVSEGIKIFGKYA